MRKQVDAQVISKEECRINKEIDRFIKKGYELLGAVSVSVLPSSTHIQCYATMVKYEIDPKIIEAFAQYKCYNCSLDSCRCSGLKCDEAVAKTLKRAGIELDNS